MYKKVYLEITNCCNLNCDFCTLKKKSNKFISVEDFNIVLDKLEGYTDYLYFHILGEPLMHPKINELIDIASNRYKVNITTNGYLLDKITSKNIRQVNISLQSYNETYDKSLDDYLNDIYKFIDNYHENTYISLRLWVKNKYTDIMVNKILEHYKIKLDGDVNNFKIINNVYFSTHKLFVWPSLNNNIYNEVGTCYGLRNQLGILVNGDIVPCCLDGEGIIKLGNIYNDNLNDIINSERYQKILNGFKNNKKCEELCKHCNFIDN